MTARVLIVEDLLFNPELLEARLSAEYLEVLTATNGVDAVKIRANGDCGIVLLDVMMPGMDGLGVCRLLKGDKATAHIPVVLVTALNQPSGRMRGLDAGADDFLSKPIDEIALRAGSIRSQDCGSSSTALKGRLTPPEASPPELPRPASWDRCVWAPTGRRISWGPCREQECVLLPLAPPLQDKRQSCFCRNRHFTKQMQWCASIKCHFYENC